MRVLTSKQKKMLDQWYAEYKPMNVDDLKYEDWQALSHVNDTEILWQEVNRYLGDKYMNEVYA